MSIQTDIDFVKSVLPDHYTVKESKKQGSIHCKSPKGIVKPPYTVRVREDVVEGRNAMNMYQYRTVIVSDAEDIEHWNYIFNAIKQHFGSRFQEVFHNTCTNHVDFTIYLKQ